MVKMRVDDGEGDNRHVGSGQKAVVDLDSLHNAIRRILLTSMRQQARRLGIGAANL